jgi:hypothetical protein
MFGLLFRLFAKADRGSEPFADHRFALRPRRFGAFRIERARAHAAAEARIIDLFYRS